MKLQRRSFIRYASLAAAGHMAGLTPFGALNALAQGSSDYKALVCIFLTGGNDGNSLLVPYDTAGYQNYSATRGPLSLPQGGLLPLTSLPHFALNPNVPEIQGLFNSNNAALVANVGTLVQPTTRASYLAGTVSTPQNLFSHIDQQTLWQNSDQYSSNAIGWGGRIADVLLGGNSPGPYPVVTSVSGAQIFCNGRNTNYSSVIPNAVGKVTCAEWTAICASRLQAAQQLLTFDTGLTLIQADDQIASDAYGYSNVLQSALTSVAPLATVFPSNNSLATQLKQIAQVIQARSVLGAGRQIFFASLNGFDTHANQLQIQGPLLAQVSAAMMAFYQATKELNVSNQVTSFTMSDFARALQPNSASGSDHGWGSHHIVVGGAVKGGKLYGTYPTLALGGPDDAGSNGRWIPTTSAAQYAATLASWFGVGAADMTTVLPLLSNFNTHNLGFI